MIVIFSMFIAILVVCAAVVLIQSDDTFDAEEYAKDKMIEDAFEIPDWDYTPEKMEYEARKEVDNQ